MEKPDPDSRPPGLAPENSVRLNLFGGPFVVADYKAGSSLLLRRNPNYWKKDSQGRRLPYLDYPTGGWIGGMQNALRTLIDPPRELGDPSTENPCDHQIIRCRLQLTLRPSNRRRSVGCTASRIGVDHSGCRVRNANDQHAEMYQRDHHRQKRCLLPTMSGRC